MEPKNHKIIRNFISKTERLEILEWINTIDFTKDEVENSTMLEITKSLKGESFIFDISKTDLTKYITNFQATIKPSLVNPPPKILRLKSIIANIINIPEDNCFLQVVDMRVGGRIRPHYDPAIGDFITYKCNLTLLSGDYNFYIDGSKLSLSEGDLYCFEASLYKHWTDEFKNRRVFLSFGFLIPPSVTGRTLDDPRMRLSKRIQKYFQNSIY